MSFSPSHRPFREHRTWSRRRTMSSARIAVHPTRLFDKFFNKKNKRWVFPNIGVPQNGWFVMENPIKMDNLGVPLFLETPRWTKCKRFLPMGFITNRSNHTFFVFVFLTPKVGEMIRKLTSIFMWVIQSALTKMIEMMNLSKLI